MPQNIVPPFIHDPSVNIFNDYVNGLARTPESRSGPKVDVKELTTARGILETNGSLREDSPLGHAKMRAFIRGLKGATFTDGARTLFQKITGITPPDPGVPPIVALYSVTIDRIVASGDRTAMLAVRAYAEMALEEHGGTSNASARTMSVEARSASSAALSGVDDEHKPRQVRAALAKLDAALGM